MSIPLSGPHGASRAGFFSSALALAKRHLHRDAPTPVRFAALEQRLARPGDARAQLEEQPFAVQAAPVDCPQAVVRHPNLAIGVSRDAGLVRECAPVAEVVIERESREPAHAFRFLGEGPRAGPAYQEGFAQQALEVDARRGTGAFVFLP